MRPIAAKLLVIAPLLVAGAFPAAGAASSVRVEAEGGKGSFITNLAYDAAPGEANRVVLLGTLASLRVEDAGASIGAGAGCTLESEHVAVCHIPQADSHNAVIRTGDGDDEVTSPFRGALELGPGNDTGRLDADGTIGGGGGRDVLVGGPGEQSFRDGDDPAAPDADSIAGGGGDDAVSYAGRGQAVSVDLRTQGPSGQVGEGDTLVGIESAVGGSGDDVLRAGSRSAALVGNAGDDQLIGGPVRDALLGGPGRDRLSGGAGNDRLEGDGNVLDDLSHPGDRRYLSGVAPADHALDRIDCGPGRDHVLELLADRIARNCESFNFLDQVGDGHPRGITLRSSVILSFRFDCGGRCFWQLEARVTEGSRGGMLLGSTRREARAGDPQRASALLRLSRAGRAFVRGRGCVEARVRVRGVELTDESGRTGAWFAYRYVLCRPRAAAPRKSDDGPETGPAAEPRES
jgi:hypothetical protein